MTLLENDPIGTTEKQCKKFWQDYPEENSAGYKYTDPDILDAVWEQWNNGSGKECDLFKKLVVRSMMVGDYVFDGTDLWN